MNAPTTAEVRDVFAIHCEGWCERCGESDMSSFEFHEFEFNQWLIAERKRVAEMAIEKERKRIIDLLESGGHYSTYKVPCDCGAPMPEQIDYIINNFIKED